MLTDPAFLLLSFAILVEPQHFPCFIVCTSNLEKIWPY